VAQVVVSELVAPGFAAVVNSDAARNGEGSWYGVAGLGASWGVVGWFGSEYRRLGGAGGSFEAGEKVVVEVVDVVVNVDGADGGCAGVVSGVVCVKASVVVVEVVFECPGADVVDNADVENSWYETCCMGSAVAVEVGWSIDMAKRRTEVAQSRWRVNR
jgi:hypothetical protein